MQIEEQKAESLINILSELENQLPQVTASISIVGQRQTRYFTSRILLIISRERQRTCGTVRTATTCFPTYLLPTLVMRLLQKQQQQQQQQQRRMVPFYLICMASILLNGRSNFKFRRVFSPKTVQQWDAIGPTLTGTTVVVTPTTPNTSSTSTIAIANNVPDCRLGWRNFCRSSPPVTHNSTTTCSWTRPTSFSS